MCEGDLMSVSFVNSVIVDFQYLRGNSAGEHFVKELAYCPLSTFHIKSYDFKSPYSLKQLTDEKALKTNEYVKNKMGINWLDGYINYNKLEVVFNRLKFQTIYVKGEKKKKLLQLYLPETIIHNLEDVISGVPSLQKMKDFKMYCEFHSSCTPCYRKLVKRCNHITVKSCAHNNVVNLFYMCHERKFGL